MRSTRCIAVLFFVGLHFILPARATGQLRPYDPFEWSLLDGPEDVIVTFGTAVLWDQRASLAGTRGTLGEFGAFRATLRTGRAMIEAGGTLYRILWEKEAFAPATGGAEERPLDDRRDAGDYRIATTLLLFDPDAPATAIVRFGTRLPTTDNVVGLERDAIDFFATIGGRYDFASIRATAELGLGIHGTRLADFEQSDVLLYILGLTARSFPLQPTLLLLGQADGISRSIRGNEHLSEVRLRLRSTGPIWLQAEIIRGLETFSPAFGIALSAGVSR